MFRDAKEELQRLEAELLAEEEREAAAEAKADREYDDGGVRFFDDAAYEEAEEYGEYGEDDGEYYVGPHLKASGRNSDETDVELEEYSDDVYRGKTKGITGLALLALLLIAAIFAVLAYAVRRFGL